MKTCANCGVLVDEHLESCPLCGEPVSTVADDGSVTSPEDVEHVDPHGRRVTDRPAPRSTVVSAKIWLFEIVTLISFTTALVVFAVDFAYGFSVSWSRYPLVCIVFLWLAGSMSIAFWHHLVLLLLSETAIVSGLLLVLSFLSGSVDWFLPLALPITILVAVVFGIGIGVSIRMKLAAFQAIGVIFLSAGFFLVGLEAVINNWTGRESLVSWSLVAFACTLSIFFLMLVINRRLKERHAEFRRIFHI